MRNIPNYLREKHFNQNIAFVDFENLQRSMEDRGLKVLYNKLIQYIADKYKVGKVYCFVGYTKKKHKNLYRELEKAGCEIKSNKSRKGDVDANLVFHIMKKFCNKTKKKIIIVSGDGDYIDVVQHFIDKGQFKIVLLPTRKSASPLYKNIIDREYYDYLDRSNVTLYTEEIEVKKNHNSECPDCGISQSQATLLQKIVKCNACGKKYSINKIK